MKIKRYTAESMRAALAQVRAEQGPDAVILSSRRIEDGIEVIAAVDYDEGLFAAATRQRTPDPVAPQPPAPAIVAAPAAASPSGRPGAARAGRHCNCNARACARNAFACTGADVACAR